MNQDTYERHMDKLSSAHVAMLGSVGALLGIIVSATSIIAAVGGSRSALLFPTIIISFLEVACVLAAFYYEKKELLRAFSVMVKMEGLPKSEQLKILAEEVAQKSAVHRLSNTALAITFVASVLFLSLCATSFDVFRS